MVSRIEGNIREQDNFESPTHQREDYPTIRRYKRCIHGNYRCNPHSLCPSLDKMGSPGPRIRFRINRLKIPSKLVALLRPTKLKTLIPCGELANAHRNASKTLNVNSASKNIVNCDKMFSSKMVRSCFEK